MQEQNTGRKLVIFGASNILSDLFDCAIANGLSISKIVLDLPEEIDARSIPLAARLATLRQFGHQPEVEQLADFYPQADELYVLGPTTPSRSDLVVRLQSRHALSFTNLIHPTAYVSPMARLGEGCFIGANSVISPGVVLGEHVFVNRGVTVGHDTHVGSYSRIQPGSQLGGLSKIGKGVTVGIGATVIERLHIGDQAFIGAGAVVTADVDANVLVVGIPAKFKKHLSE